MPSTTSTIGLTLTEPAATEPLVAALEHRFEDPELLELALAHRSWCAENGDLPSNERLEFLGDAVLGLTIAEEVYQRYPDLAEGQLAKLRAGVVNSVTLAQVARGIELGDALKLGKGERATGGSDKQSILADALEAVIGALYLDAGLETVQRLILRLWSPVIEETLEQGPGGSDHKTRLQEVAVARLQESPSYDVSTSGPDHARVFTAEVRVGDSVLGSGVGSSKKEAEQAAAGEAVQAIESDEGVAQNRPERACA